jgi:beta-lactamase class A
VVLPVLVVVAGAAACQPQAGADGENEGASPAGSAARPAPETVRDTMLEAALLEVAAGIDGAVGVAVARLPAGAHATVIGDRPFALASVQKLAIAYAALQRGHASPDDSVRIEPGDIAPGTTPFSPGDVVPVARLVERSLARSDNTASDALLRLAGGPTEVTRRVQILRAGGVRVDRSMREIFATWQGAPDPRDMRDTGTAEGVVALLAAIHGGEGLSADARRLLLDALTAADTGPNRIRAGVPAGTAVAHKTGTLGTLTHDVGIIQLTGPPGAVALAVLIESGAPLADRERLIADIARLVWEAFHRRTGDGRQDQAEAAWGRTSRHSVVGPASRLSAGGRTSRGTQ